MIWIISISLVFLILIATSDFRTRQIPVLYLLGEIIVSAYLAYNLIGSSIVKVTIVNFVLVSLQILMLWLWIKTKKGESGKGLWSKFGKGDLFMLAVLALNLSALNYLLFTIFVSFGSIVIWLGISALRKMRNQTIPFAGFIAAGLMIIRIIQITGNKVIFYSDSSILNHFSFMSG